MDTVPLPVPDPTRLAKAFEKALPGMAAQERMAGRVVPHPQEIPADARESAVLVLLQTAADGGPQVILIERTEDRSAHSRQIAFPGGRRDPEDATLWETALREAWEEIGLEKSAVQLLGPLTPLYIPVSRFHVYPFTALAPANLALQANPAEVVRILRVPLERLFDPQNRIIAEVNPVSKPGTRLQVPAYKLPGDGALVWGATAMILSELQTLLSDG